VTLARELQAAVREAEVVDAARALIRARSVTGAEGPAVEAAGAWLAARGVAGTVVGRTADRPNLLAEVGPGGRGPLLVLNGHLDTVPVGPGEGWDVDPWGGDVRDGRLYGRGALDMKGACGAMLHAVAVLAAAAPRLAGRVQLQLVADEEATAHFGTGYLVELMAAGRLARPDWVLIGEKSDLKIRVAERGQFQFHLVFRGRAAHTATARLLGVNPIAHAAAAVLRLDRHLEAFHPAVGHPVVSVNRIQAGVANNQVPAECTVTVDRRLVPGETRESVVAEVEAALADVRGQFPDLDARLVPVTGPDGREEYNPANMTPPDHALVGRVRAGLRDVTGREPELFVDWAGATDARLFRALGIPTVVLGAVGSGFHGANEHARVDSLVTLARVYLAVAADLLGPGASPGGHSS
jgi:acetylornithine deacetylase/succinyl-diaminopimelate desuccinylase-like protein